MKYESNRLVRMGDALSQFINVVLFDGHPNESISGRCWRERLIWYKVIDLILWFDKNHCKTAYENDIAYCKQIIANLSK